MSTPMLGTGPMRGFGPMLGVGPMLGRSPLSGPVSQTPTFALDPQNDEYFGLSEAVTFSSPTGGVAVQDYQGNFHITEAGEIPVKGGRRLRNLLASTAAPSTQGVTVQDTDYFLSFKGTGSVAVSGVATDSLAGTGASDRVSKKITMGSAGTATFTVTGTVTDAYLYKARPGQTEPDPEYISNGVLSAPYHGHGIDGLAWLKTDPDGNDLTDPASGYPVLRTGVPRWPQITNLIRYSDDVSNAAWTKSEITVTADSVDGPLPSQLDALTPSTNATTHNFLQSSSATATGYYTASAYAKANGYNFLSFRLDRSLAGAYVCFNLSDGTISQAAGIAAGSDWANASATITHVGGGVYRCALTAQKTSATNAVRFIGWVGNANMTSDSGVSFAGDGTSGVAVGGLQLEASGVAHAYVPTTSTSVTASPLLITPDKDAIGWPDEGGTWVIAHTAEHDAATGAELLDVLTDADNRIAVTGEGGNTQLLVRNGGVEQAAINGAGWDAGTEQIVAARVIADDVALVADGTEEGSDASATVPTITDIYIGGDSGSTYEGVISQVAFYAES